MYRWIFFSPPNQARNAWWAAYCELDEIKATCLYLGPQEIVLIWEQLSVSGLDSVFSWEPLQLESSDDPMILFMCDGTVDQYEFGTLELSRSFGMHFQSGNKSVAAVGLMQYLALRSQWWSFALPNKQWLIDHSLLGGSVISVAWTHVPIGTWRTTRPLEV